MLKLLITICVILAFATISSAQTQTELANKYPHHEVYEVQPGVQMTAKFASNGLVCELLAEQAHFGKNGADLSDGIDENRISGLLDELVPPSQRGKMEPPGHSSLVSGNDEESITSYEYVTISVWYSLSRRSTVAVIVKWRHRTC
jgi:hypothetical protein